MLKISGNVGIGTTNPGAKLEVVGQVKITGGTPGANKGLTSDANGLASWQTPASFSEADTLQTVTTRGNTTSLGLVVNGQTIDHQTNNFFYVNSYDGMQLRINSDGAGTSNFQINNSANSSVLTVTNAGNVGIGTTAPGKKLDVVGSIRTSIGHIITNNPNGALVLNAGPANDTNLAGIWFRKATTLGEEEEYTNLMRITETGNVGIGTGEADIQTSCKWFICRPV